MIIDHLTDYILRLTVSLTKMDKVRCCTRMILTKLPPRQYVGKCLSWMEAEWEEGQVDKTNSKDFLLPNIKVLQFCHFLRLTHYLKAGLGGCLNILLLPTSRES